ncbi:MAG TPA: hypothetical protein VE978_10860 [Chitinophagales bacterium]|nr:hypothetical protein [Chitinophagales bacterium]
MKRIFLLFVLMLIEFVVKASSPLQFIGAGSVSIFQPVFADDTLVSKKIYLLNQQIRIDVYRGYAVVRADYWFNNSSDATVFLPVGFPSCPGGFFQNKNSGEQNCSELYWLRIMINNGAPFAASVLTNDSLLLKRSPGQKNSGSKILFQRNPFGEKEKYSSWQTWNISFLPGVSVVSLNYGVKTGDVELLINKDSIQGNALQYSFSNYKWWEGGKENGEIWMRMSDGYITKDILGLLPDKKFLGGNSIVHAAMKDVVNDSAQRIVLWYRKLDDATVIPSHVNWERNFFKLNDWITNKKILATLSPFSATDYEGKAFMQEEHSASSLLWWSAIAGIVIVAVFLLLFIYADRKKAR